MKNLYALLVVFGVLLVMLATCSDLFGTPIELTEATITGRTETHFVQRSTVWIYFVGVLFVVVGCVAKAVWDDEQAKLEIERLKHVD